MNHLDLINRSESDSDAHDEDVAGGRLPGRKPTCRACGTRLERTFVDLGMSPLVQSFVPEDKLDEAEVFFPLRVLVCDNCKLVQLRSYVGPESIFSEYAYFSSFSSSWVTHAKRFCESVRERFALDDKSFVVEIASNDGYLLQHFVDAGIPVLGIEPAANVAAAAKAKSIPVRVDFFSDELAGALVREGPRADLIIGNNVFAHVPDLNDFCAGMKRLLAPEGVISLEFPHLEKLMAQRQFDTIYHEHFSYYSLLTAQRALARHGLSVFDVEELSTHGGSLRVFACHQNSKTHERTARADALIAREVALGFDDVAIYEDFQFRVQKQKRDLLRLLCELKEGGKTIAGYGAPGKGNTLLNYCGIGPDFLDFTVDRNPYKQGLYTPGTHIPIRPVEAIAEARPDFVFILPWNLKQEIISQMSDVFEWGGKFIVAIPDVEIIERDPGQCGSEEAQEPRYDPGSRL